MFRFNISSLILGLLLAVLASALPHKRQGMADEAFHMADEMMSDPAFQSKMQTGSVIGPSTTTTPTATPTSALRMHGPAAASSSSTMTTTPAASAASAANKESSPTSTIVVSATPSVTSTSKGSDPKEKENLLSKLPVLGDLGKMLGLGS